MANNIQIPKINFVSIIERDPVKMVHFETWIRFLNEHSIVRFALSTNVKLNVELLRHVHTTATNSSTDEQLAFSFIIGDDTIRITGDDLNEHLQLPRDTFDDIPEDWELLSFFRVIVLFPVD